MKKKLGILILAILGFYLVCIYKVYTFSNQYYESKSDIALVLGAGIHDSELSPVFEERMNHAIFLYKIEAVDYILITGGLSEGESISDSKAAMLYAVNQGVPVLDILIEETSTLTIENIINAKLLMTQFDLHTALLVSDAYHLRRAILMCNQKGIQALPSPTQTSAYQSKGVKRKFLLKEAFFYAFQVLFGWMR